MHQTVSLLSNDFENKSISAYETVASKQLLQPNANTESESPATATAQIKEEIIEDRPRHYYIRDLTRLEYNDD